MRNLHIERVALHQKGLTVEQHDQKVEDAIAAGVEPESPGRIVCPACGFRLLDVPDSGTTDFEGKAFLQCGCMRCGNRVWRRAT